MRSCHMNGDRSTILAATRLLQSKTNIIGYNIKFGTTDRPTVRNYENFQFLTRTVCVCERRDV